MLTDYTNCFEYTVQEHYTCVEEGNLSLYRYVCLFTCVSISKSSRLIYDKDYSVVYKFVLQHVLIIIFFFTMK